MESKFKRTNRVSVYILECRDGTFYKGYINDLGKRIKEHNKSKRAAKYLQSRRPIKVVWCKEYRYLKNVIKKEIEIEVKALSKGRADLW